MEKITIDNKTCILLNHQILIQKLYEEHVNNNFASYSLREQIFNFTPKSSNVSSENISNSKRLKTVNRKRKGENANETAPLINNLHIKLFIEETKRKCANLPRISDNLPRFWDEEHEFPQFRGANETKEYQITEFSKRSYIIPPKTKFFNYNIKYLTTLLPELGTYDLVIIDMPWQNKYIKRLKKVKTSLAYEMINNETLKNMPIPQLIHKNSLVVLWCTNAIQHRKAIEEEFLPKWNLQLVHTLKWLKINTLGDLISPLKPEGYKQPYEMIFITCPQQRNLSDLEELQTVDYIISIPSIIHSHKPPLVEWLKKFVSYDENFKGLEFFARYLLPQFTSIGMEVLKLMDKRLYNVIQK